MNSSTNFLNKLFLCLALLFIGGCTTASPPSLRLTAVAPESEWRIAVFPIENLSGVPVPLETLRQELMAEMGKVGLRPIGLDEVDRFINRNWVRYTGGVDEKTAQVLRRETGADAVLITTVEFYDEGDIPKFSFNSRLVTTGAMPEIFWMETVGMSGDDHPGVLGLGLITNAAELRRKGLGKASASLERYLSDPATRERRQFEILDHHKPRLLYNGIPTSAAGKPSIGVVPIINQSTRKNAGEILLLHIVRHLVNSRKFMVVEPGVIRDNMLRRRIIMKEGISLPSFDLLANSLATDMMLIGSVFRLQDSIGGSASPKADFSLQVLDRQTKKLLWSSRSYNQGDDGVYFYDWGRSNTTSELTDQMIDSLTREMARD